MELHQVNSRVIHDDFAEVATISDQPQHQEGDLEKRTTAVSNASYIEAYPEGGLKAWLVVFGSWCALFSSMGLMNTIALFQAYILSHQLKGYSEGTVGWVFSIYTFLAFFCGVYIGPIFDKYGPRWLIVTGAACVVGGILAMSFCTRASPTLSPSKQKHTKTLQNSGNSSSPSACFAASAHLSSLPPASQPLVTGSKPAEGSQRAWHAPPVVWVVSSSPSCRPLFLTRLATAGPLGFLLLSLCAAASLASALCDPVFLLRKMRLRIPTFGSSSKSLLRLPLLDSSYWSSLCLFL